MQAKATDLLLLSAALPGVGGLIKNSVEDFEVVELPLYEAAGEGEHVYLRIRRAGQNTRDIADRIAAALKLPQAAIGFAGLKDKNAISEQTFSVHWPGRNESEMEQKLPARLPGCEILWMRRHRNKLRTGHLRGNRFRAAISGVDPAHLARLDAKLSFIQSHGVPNYFGEQRFGADGDNASRGLAILKGQDRARGWNRRFLLSAWQSERFNRWLQARTERGEFDRLFAGDVARKRESGGLFVVQDLTMEEQRLRTGEIDCSGPIFGRSMTAAEHRPGEIEAELLAESGVSQEDLRQAGLEGGRRAARVAPQNLTLLAADEGRGRIELCFELPPGAYATILLAELIHGSERESTAEN